MAASEHAPSAIESSYDTPMRDFPLYRRALYNFVLAILFVFSKLMWRWKVEDAGKLVPEGKTGSVIICNHTSMAEVLPLVTHIWASGRRVRPIYKSEFDSIAIARWAFPCVAGGIPVDRGTGDVRMLRAAQHALQRGEDILIFPEGTRVRSDDQPVEVHGGFALIAQMGKAPIVPMAVCGFRDITPAGKKLMRPKKCWIRVGDAVSASDAPGDLKRRDRARWVEDEALRRMFALRDQLRDEHPGRF